jgi:23S rRNA pseudouridine1911/1915/1917 synthase
MSLNTTRISESFFSRYWRWQIDAADLRSGVVRSGVAEELSRRLPHIAPDSWSERFSLGGIYLAGRPASLEAKITEPCRLEYYEPKLALEELASWYPAFSSSWVLYSDDDLAIVYKPSRLPTTPARDQQRYSLERYLIEHFAKPVHLPSRLDTAVSGIVICSLSKRMNRYLQKAYERRWIEKFYLAQTSSIPPWSALNIDADIARDPQHPVLRRCVPTGQGESALTELACLEKSGSLAIVQARPVTGRTHQIRLHLASAGFPIVGDPYYNGAEAAELRLVSYAIRFHHPYLGAMLKFELPQIFRPDWLGEVRGLETLEP